MRSRSPMQHTAHGLELQRLGRILCAGAVLLVIPLTAWHAAILLASLDARGVAPAVWGLLLGVLAADGLTGLIHWTCDTWGDAETRWLGPGLIHSFREHHRDERAMLEHDWIEVNREPALAVGAALLLLLLPSARSLLDSQVIVQGFVCGLAVFGGTANQLHLWAHSHRPPRWVRLAQRSGVILSPERHARHHDGGHISAYCISSGWLNPALDRSGFWRALEGGISRLTGAKPRATEAG